MRQVKPGALPHVASEETPGSARGSDTYLPTRLAGCRAVQLTAGPGNEEETLGGKIPSGKDKPIFINQRLWAP